MALNGPKYRCEMIVGLAIGSYLVFLKVITKYNSLGSAVADALQRIVSVYLQQHRSKLDEDSH